MKFGPWEIWNGGKCPVDPDTKVHVQYAYQSRTDTLGYPVILKASDFQGWVHIKDEYIDIIAYREVIEPVRETITEYGVYDNVYGLLIYKHKHPETTVKITYDLLDGEIDCSTLRAEPIK